MVSRSRNGEPLVKTAFAAGRIPTSCCDLSGVPTATTR